MDSPQKKIIPLLLILGVGALVIVLFVYDRLPNNSVVNNRMVTSRAFQGQSTGAVLKSVKDDISQIDTSYNFNASPDGTGLQAPDFSTDLSTQ